ncbi:MAG: ATP-binding protein [Deltaproteobacteria bacterium]|nr:ATP-binding protein [Deltaproteobacteria bacterium]
MASHHSKLLRIVELALTAEIFNQWDSLTADDLPAGMGGYFIDAATRSVHRPLKITAAHVEQVMGSVDFHELAAELPFLDLKDPASGLGFLDFGEGAGWFANQDSFEIIRSNPVLALYYQKYDPNVSYMEAKLANEPTRLPGAEGGAGDLLDAMGEEGQDAQDILKLVSIKYPEQIRNSLDDLVLTEEQRMEIAKAGKAIEYRDYLREVGLREIGKILFIGPPGTGKTTAARALSRWFRLPLLEVRLSMIISHYLGETSKNIDRVFLLAKRLSPCIIFIDEFDFVAKTRTADDHGAIKRAVNTLLKAIDDISLVEDGVLLIAATNHPQLLDHAAWRRFDKIMSFTLPDEEMRCRILQNVLQRMDAAVDARELAKSTEGYTGSDLRLVVREAVLNALLQDRKRLDQGDLLRAVEDFGRRNSQYRDAETV